jgi:Ca2+/Na+ antiporter
MTSKTRATINSLAAVFVLFTAMLDPRISVVLAIVFLLALAVYELGHNES